MHMSSSKDDASNNTEEEEAYHVLKIDGYSSAIGTKDDMLCIVSCVFPAGGHNWQILCYPMGAHGSENMGFIALFVVRHDADAVDDEAVVAEATFSLLDHDGKRVPTYSCTTGKETFLKYKGFGYYDFLLHDFRQDKISVTVPKEKNKSVTEIKHSTAGL
ncbi:hypothetical protein EJB05_03464, partial [Eragrostis curvula]